MINDLEESGSGTLEGGGARTKALAAANEVPSCDGVDWSKMLIREKACRLSAEHVLAQATGKGGLQLNRGAVQRLSPRAPELNAKSFCNEIAEFAFKSRSKWGRDWFTI